MPWIIGLLIVAALATLWIRRGGNRPVDDHRIEAQQHRDAEARSRRGYDFGGGTE